MRIKIKIKINSPEDIVKHNIPISMLDDVNKRITDWLASGGTMDDPYIKQQYRYIENYLNNR